MAVLKVIEIMSNSEKSWKDAVNNAVAEASKTVKNIKSVWVKDQDALVRDGRIVEYRVITKITFQIED